MRKILIFCLLLLPVVMWAKKNKHKNKNKSKVKVKHMPIGRFVEVKRLNPDSSVVTFKDTLFMTFGFKDSFTYRLRDGFVYRGKYTLDDNGHLEFGTTSYELAARKYNAYVLYNAKGIYYFETDTTALPPDVVIEKDEPIQPVTSIDQMIGHWTVYKRTVGEDGGGVDPDLQIKSAYITGQSSDDKQGFLFCGKDPDNMPSYYIKTLGVDQSLECSGKFQRFLKVVKCQKGEMILEESGVTYYFKQFR